MRNLKLLTTLPLIAGMLLFSSCDDDSSDANITADIKGAWAHESGAWSITVDGTDIVNFLSESLEMSEEKSAEFVGHFGYSRDDTDFKSGNWTFQDDGILLISINNIDESGTWSLSADKSKLTIAFDGSTGTMDVIALTSNSLVLDYQAKFNVDVDQDGDTELYKTELSLTMTR